MHVTKSVSKNYYRVTEALIRMVGQNNVMHKGILKDLQQYAL